MSKTFAVVSGKGGVGKSTTASGLGRAFSDKQLKTLLIDCDAGLSSLDVLLHVGDKVVFSWFDAVCQRCKYNEAILPINDFLHLSPAPLSPLREEAPDAVKQFCDAVFKDYDIIIIDAPAGLGAGFERAVKAAQALLVVATADDVSIKDAAAVQNQTKDKSLSEVRLIVNRYRVKKAKKGYMLSVDELIDRSYVQLIGIVPEDEKLIYQSAKPVNKKGKSALAYERIADRMLGKDTTLNLKLLR